jgi:hypothetical protein
MLVTSRGSFGFGRSVPTAFAKWEDANDLAAVRIAHSLHCSAVSSQLLLWSLDVDFGSSILCAGKQTSVPGLPTFAVNTSKKTGHKTVGYEKILMWVVKPDVMHPEISGPSRQR